MVVEEKPLGMFIWVKSMLKMGFAMMWKTKTQTLKMIHLKRKLLAALSLSILHC
jgi:hypothetical protein